MAPSKNKKTPFLFFFFYLLIATFLALPRTATPIPTDSMDTILFLLHTNGHALLANAISTSDLLFDLLSLPSLTLLAPPDPSLFAIDMAHSPNYYLSSLRLHVVPTLLDLTPLLLPNSTSAAYTYLPTLLTSRDLHLSSTASSVSLDGVQVVFPRLYHSRDSAVYRLASVLPALPPNFALLNPPALSPYALLLAPAPSPSPSDSDAVMTPNFSPAGSLVLGSPQSPVEPPRADGSFTISPAAAKSFGEISAVKRHQFKPEEEQSCGPLEREKILCALTSSLTPLSSDHQDDNLLDDLDPNDHEDRVGFVDDDYTLRHYAATDYGE